MTSTTDSVTLVVMLVVVSLLLSGCGGPQGIKEVNYFQGPDGLVMEFMENSPPEKMYPEMEYPVTMTVHNSGAFSLLKSVTGDDLYASITLIYDPFYFTEVSQQYTLSAHRTREELYFEGKSIYWPTGELKVLTLGVLRANDIGKNRIGADTDIIASMCFPYETKLTTQVCVDNDPFENTNPAQPCHTENLVFMDQGAPVAIKNVEVQTMPVGTERQQVLVRQGITDENGSLIGFEEVLSEELVTRLRPTFRLFLENVGDGQVVRGRERGEYKSCLKEAWDELPSNSLVVTAFLGNKELVCKPNPAVMRDNKAEVVCMMRSGDDLVSSTNYYDILQVYVGYVYQVRERLTVQIDDSMKQYAPPDLTTFKCMDFDNNYAACRSYAESMSEYQSGLDCYYCESTKKCGPASDCGSCPDGSVVDRVARKCGSPCPQPTASAIADTVLHRVTLTCVDHASVGPNDESRCGCSQFAYRFVKEKELCDDVGQYEYSLMGVHANGRTTAYASIPQFAREGSDWYVCVVGRTPNDVVSRPASSLIRYYLA